MSKVYLRTLWGDEIRGDVSRQALDATGAEIAGRVQVLDSKGVVIAEITQDDVAVLESFATEYEMDKKYPRTIIDVTREGGSVAPEAEQTT